MNSEKHGTQLEHKEFFALTADDLLVATALTFRARGWSNIQTVGFGLTAHLRKGFEETPFLAVVTCLEIGTGLSELMITLFTSATGASIDSVLNSILNELQMRCAEVQGANN